MKKKIIAVRKYSNGENRIEVEAGRFNEEENEIDVNVELCDNNKKKITRKEQLWNNHGKNKIVIKLTIYLASLRQELSENDVKYWLNDITEETEYLSCKNKALSQYIIDKIIKKRGDKKKEVDDDEVSDLRCTILQSPNDKSNEIFVKVKEKNPIGPAGNKEDIIRFEDITIKAFFQLDEKTEADEIMVFLIPQKPEKPFWTWKKIFFVGFVGFIIVALLYYYRKKIWAWIRREDKTKKKEQVEIF